MNKKFARVIEVTIEGKTLTNDDIDIDFMYDFDDELENNVSEINLWNVNNDTINRINKGSEIVLKAGYKGDVGVILVGKVGDMEVNYYDVDKELKLYVSDGVNLWGRWISKTYRSMMADEIIRDLLSIVGLSIGQIALTNNRSYNNLVVNCSLEEVLKNIAHNTNSKFYIKNGMGYFVSKEYADKEIVVLNRYSGLLNSPTKQTIDVGEDDNRKSLDGWKIDCLLEHRITVGSRVSVQSKTANGMFRVVKGKHDSSFTTSMEVLPV